jgi:hypothetical protein
MSSFSWNADRLIGHWSISIDPAFCALRSESAWLKSLGCKTSNFRVAL